MSLSTNTTSPPRYTSSPPQSSRGLPRPTAPSRQSFDRPATAQRMGHASEQQGTFESAVENAARRHEEADQHEPNHIAQSSFQPFFTLIEDANTSEYYHPTVHYIFSDDDADIVTEASLRALEGEQDNLPDSGKARSKPKSTRNQRNPEDTNDGYPGQDDSEPLTPRKESLLPPPIPGIRDNYIILDMDSAPDDAVYSGLEAARGGPGPGLRSISSSPAAQGIPISHHQHQHSQQQGTPASPPPFTITSAHSLTPAWQVLNTQLVPAPTFENHASGDQPSSNGGLMLKIHGTAGLPVTMFGKDRDKERGSQRLEEMMEQFDKRLGELRQVIEAGDHAPHIQGGPFGGDSALDDQEANIDSRLNPNQPLEGRSDGSKTEAGNNISL